MKLFKLDDMTRGWFVGAFEPTAWSTPQFEVGYRVHKVGSRDDHYHTVVTEINLIISGCMRLQDRLLGAGDIFILEPWEITNPEFLEDTGIVCVKVPSLNDKKSLSLG